MFRKAERKQAKLRLALCATSGAGKTYGALLLAKGMGGKVALLDTENGSGDLYANLFDYDVAPIVNSYEPAKYIEIIKGAEAAGYTTLIIDSLSHAWSAEGGILDLQAKAEKASKSKNGYYAWRDVTPLHNALVNAILQSNMHIIATIRSKTAYEAGKDSSGKFVANKVGLAPIQRDGMEYEFTAVLDISNDGHLCTASKDRTMLFDGKHFTITEKTGTELLGWLNDGTSQEEVKQRETAALEIKYTEHLSKLNECHNIDDLRHAFSAAFHDLKGTEFEARITEKKDAVKARFEDKDPKVMTLRKAKKIIEGETSIEALNTMKGSLLKSFEGDEVALGELSVDFDLRMQELEVVK